MMSKRDEFQIVVKLAVDDKEGEAAKREAANACDATDSRHDATCRGTI